MNRNRFSSLLLASLLLLSLAAPARAADSPGMTVSQDESGWSVVLTGLEEQYCGVEATLTLNSPADAQFLIDSGLESSRPSAYAAYRQEGAQVTVYLVAKSPLNDGGSVRLGSLDVDSSVTGITVSSLQLLTLEDLTDAFPNGSQNVPIQPPVPPDTPSSGGTTPSPEVPPSDQDPWTDRPAQTAEYRINILSGLRNGSVSVNLRQARPGDAVTVTVSPDAGYELEELTVTAAGGGEVPLTGLGGGRYRFTMPRSAVTVRAAFIEEVVIQDPVSQPEPVLPAIPLPFLDVPADAWYYEAVAYVYECDLMRGTDTHAFTPGGFTTRAQIVTILHRLEGEPLVVETGSFNDVEADRWYTSAVEWAAGQGIVDGYGDGRFGPGDDITREQLAAILYRYARYKNLDLSAYGDISSFQDASSVSGWALQAMSWANGSGLVTGKEGNRLDPGGNATRAEAATILMRFRKDLV